MQSQGLWRNDRHEYYWQDATGLTGPVPGITSVIRAVDKSGPLIGWAKKITAEAAVRNLNVLPGLVSEGGEQAAVDFLKKIADHKRDTKADLGTRVHKLAEAIARKEHIEVTEDEAPYVNAYLKWMAEWRPTFFAAEYMVFSLRFRYGGTGDLVVGMRGERWRLDTKTSAGVYAETALQLAAAHFADFSGRPNDPKKYAVPKATKHGVLHLRGDGTYDVVPYDVNEETFGTFCAARRVWDWLEGPAKSVVGKPVVAQMEAVA